MRRVLPLFLVLMAASPAAAQRYLNPNEVPAPERPAALVPLYLSQVVLQGLDVHSTVVALDRGHRELNPLFRSGRPGVMVGTKLATSVASMWVSETLWKRRRRTTAVLLMIGVNVAMTAVVANNYQIAKDGRAK